MTVDAMMHHKLPQTRHERCFAATSRRCLSLCQHHAIGYIRHDVKWWLTQYAQLAVVVSVCSCGAATPPRNQMLCGGKLDHVWTCMLGSCQRWQGGSTDAQCGCLMETGCTSASAWAEMVHYASLAPGEVGTRHGNSWVSHRWSRS